MEKIFHNQVDMNSNETSINDLIPNFFTVFNENNENDPLNKTYINDEQNIVLSNECCGNDNNSKDREVCKNLNEILNNEAIENNMERLIYFIYFFIFFIIAKITWLMTHNLFAF